MCIRTCFLVLVRGCVGWCLRCGICAGFRMVESVMEAAFVLVVGPKVVLGVYYDC